jgi:glycosyltransferase involved in cell wall biosynthesis
MQERYKDFPPGWGHLKIPTSSRQAARAGLALYSPCKPAGFLAQRVTWEFVRLFGPKLLPWPSEGWTTALHPDTWSRLAAEWRKWVGPFDTKAIYARTQDQRAGLSCLLIRRGCPIGFVKMAHACKQRIRAEFEAAKLVGAYRPSAFKIPEVLTSGSVDQWNYVLYAPLAAGLHRPVVYPPLSLILSEIREALADLSRSPNTPAHWEPMHGDLTPWNLRQTDDGSLVLIDWEEAGWGPPEADRVLYVTVAAHLSGGSVPHFTDPEPVEFWKQRRLNESRPRGRDKKLARSMARAFDLVRAPAIPSWEVNDRPRLLVFAYAGEPGRGSEPGAGWGIIKTLAAMADCVVLTAPEHIPGIQQWQLEHPESATQFIEVPEARIGSYAKWHRLPWFLLYLDWLRRAYKLGLALHEERPFDAVYHATYSAFWLPTPAVRFGVPVLWGPVGGAARTPWRLWPVLGLKGLADELLDRVAVRLATWWPATRRTWSLASVRMVQNEETLRRLPKRLRSTTHVLNHVQFIDAPKRQNCARKPYALYISDLESRKGCRLAIHAMRHTRPEIELLIAGAGPDRRVLERLVSRLGLQHQIHFLGQIERPRVFELLSECGVAVFCGLREEGGLALAEAMLSGAPVVVLSNGGARTVAGSATDPRRVALVLPSTPAETARRIGHAIDRFTDRINVSTTATLDQESARKRLGQLVREVTTSSLVRRAR